MGYTFRIYRTRRYRLEAENVTGKDQGLKTDMNDPTTFPHNIATFGRFPYRNGAM